MNGVFTPMTGEQIKFAVRLVRKLWPGKKPPTILELSRQLSVSRQMIIRALQEEREDDLNIAPGVYGVKS